MRKGCRCSRFGHCAISGCLDSWPTPSKRVVPRVVHRNSGRGLDARRTIPPLACECCLNAQPDEYPLIIKGQIGLFRCLNSVSSRLLGWSRAPESSAAHGLPNGYCSAHKRDFFNRHSIGASLVHESMKSRGIEKIGGRFLS